jgi:hypothetical protein
MDLSLALASFVFFFCLVALVLVTLIFGTYAAYSLFVTLVGTAAGSDEIVWPGEPLQENVPLFIFFCWILGIWAVPAYLVLDYAGVTGLRSLFWIIGFLWLIFPVSLLSSLSASTRWIIFRPSVVRLFAKQLPTVLGFYLSTLALVGVCTWIFYIGATGPIPAIGAAGLVGAAGVLVYGRLLGRLAWLLGETRLKTKRKKNGKIEETEVQVIGSWGPTGDDDDEEEDENKESDTELEMPALPGMKKKKRLRDRFPAADLSTAPLPEEPAANLPAPVLNAAGEEDPLGPSSGSYGIATEQATPAQPASEEETAPTDPELEAFQMAPKAESGPVSMPPSATPDLTKVEQELLKPRQPKPPPRPLLLRGVYTFPFYSSSLRAFATLAFGLICMNGLMHALADKFTQLFPE